MNRILTTEQWHESLAEAFHKAVKSACQDLIDDAVKAEREACAQLCEAEAEKWEGDDGPISTEARLCAFAIRARGEKE